MTYLAGASMFYHKQLEAETVQLLISVTSCAAAHVDSDHP